MDKLSEDDKWFSIICQQPEPPSRIFGQESKYIIRYHIKKLLDHVKQTIKDDFADVELMSHYMDHIFPLEELSDLYSGWIDRGLRQRQQGSISQCQARNGPKSGFAQCPCMTNSSDTIFCMKHINNLKYGTILENVTEIRQVFEYHNLLKSDDFKTYIHTTSSDMRELIQSNPNENISDFPNKYPIFELLRRMKEKKIKYDKITEQSGLKSSEIIQIHEQLCWDYNVIQHISQHANASELTHNILFICEPLFDMFLFLRYNKIAKRIIWKNRGTRFLSENNFYFWKLVDMKFK